MHWAWAFATLLHKKQSIIDFSLNIILIHYLMVSQYPVHATLRVTRQIVTMQNVTSDMPPSQAFDSFAIWHNH